MYALSAQCDFAAKRSGRPSTTSCWTLHASKYEVRRSWRSILYDNTRLAVARILGDGRRKRTRVFSELVSHYLFEDRFGRPGKGNDKGKVEGLVGYARRNFLVPVPSFPSFDALNAYLEERCLERLGRQLRGHNETIGQRMERDLETLLALPAVPYDASDHWCGTGPTTSGHREVVVRGYWASSATRQR